MNIVINGITINTENTENLDNPMIEVVNHINTNPSLFSEGDTFDDVHQIFAKQE